MNERERDILEYEEDYLGYEELAKEMDKQKNAKRKIEEDKERYRKIMNEHMTSIMKNIDLTKQQGQGIRQSFFIQHFLATKGLKGENLSRPICEVLKKQVANAVKILNTIAKRQKIGPFSGQSQKPSLLDKKSRKIFHITFTSIVLKNEYKKYTLQDQKQVYAERKKKFQDLIMQLNQTKVENSMLRKQNKRLTAQNELLKKKNGTKGDNKQQKMEIIWQIVEKRQQISSQQQQIDSKENPSGQDEKEREDSNIPRLQDYESGQQLLEAEQEQKRQDKVVPQTSKSQLLVKKTERLTVFEKSITDRKSQKFKGQDFQVYSRIVRNFLSNIIQQEHSEPQTMLKSPKQKKEKK